SKKLDATQRRWSTYDREFFGLLTGIRNNSHYLRVKPFFAVTDHRPLLAWRKQDSKKDVTGRRMRWVLELESYDFELIYRQGRKHSDADALSRLENADEECATDHELLEGLESSEPIEAHLLGMSDVDTESAVKYTCLSSYLQKLRHEQDGDPVISNFKGYVRSRRRPPKSGFNNLYTRNFKNFLIKNGVLYLMRLEPLTDMVTLRSVIPPSLIGDVLKDAHGSMLSGHPGKARMLAKLDRSVAWEGMADDVARHIEKCKQCDLVRERKPAIRAPLQPVVAKRVGDHVICDLLKLPTAPGNFNYVLVCMDVFSKYVNLFKLRDKEAPGVAKCIQDLCLSRGMPKKLGTDNGTEFVNHILNSLAKLMGIEKATSVVYRPQSQGAVERHNRQIIAEMQKRLEQYGKNWAEHLPFVQYSYNSTPHSATGEAPFKVIYGREPPLPKFDDVDIDDHKDKSVRRYVQDLQKRLETL
ncbi:MAG: DDE-type integrase/transposase/recombinase, partial [Bacteroidota bacterium]